MKVRLTNMIEQQINMEMKYSKSYVREFVREDLEGTEDFKDKVYMAIQCIKEWIAKDHYPKKKERISSLTEEQIHNVIMDVMVLLCSEGRIQALTGVVGRCVHSLDMEYLDAVRTVGELTWFMCEADLVNIYPAFASPIKIKGEGTIAIQPCYAIDDKTAKRIQQTMHIPPMISKPRTIKTNKDCGYYTLNKPVILKGYNQHNKKISLDVINLFNSNELSLDVEFLKHCEEVLKPSKRNKEGILSEDMVFQYEKFKEQSLHVMLDIVNKGNKFYLTHHFDSVGRTYAKGYHITSQGSEYRKAMLNFAEELPLEVDEDLKTLFL